MMLILGLHPLWGDEDIPREAFDMRFDTRDKVFFFSNLVPNFQKKKKDPYHIVYAEHKHFMYEYIQELAANAGVTNAKQLSKELCLLIEGATVQAHVCGDRTVAKTAKRMLKCLLRGALVWWFEIIWGD